MKCLIRTHNDVVSITNGIIWLQPFPVAISVVTTRLNLLAPLHFEFSSVCKWNLMVTADDHP
jgi:hypothetical protein